jgi:hypothetical protein
MLESAEEGQDASSEGKAGGGAQRDGPVGGQGQLLHGVLCGIDSSVFFFKLFFRKIFSNTFLVERF